MRTSVANVLKERYDVYIGRPGRGLSGPFGNPFKIGRDGTREECLKKYGVYFYEKVNKDPGFREAVFGLKGKVLGCFCRPPGGFKGQLLCHGQVIAGWLEGVLPESIP